MKAKIEIEVEIKSGTQREGMKQLTRELRSDLISFILSNKEGALVDVGKIVISTAIFQSIEKLDLEEVKE